MRVEWCDNSREEYERLCQLLLEQATIIRLAESKRPNSFWARSDPRDVARVEARTFICSSKADDAVPTNNGADPHQMRGRTLYVLPFSVGLIGPPIARLGVQLTDSPHLAVCMAVMARIGAAALADLGDDGELVPCLQSVGVSLAPGETDVA